MEYKKFIAKLQQMVNSGKITVEVVRRMRADFVPESEDERIRKSLINYVYCHGDAGDFTKKEFIAWLEKQGKNYVRWNENTDGNKPQKNHSVLMKTTHGIAEGEWNGDGSWIQYRWSSSIKDSDVLFWIELSDLEKQGKDNMGISEATKKELEDNLNKALEKETPESCNEFLDGQGEQKPTYKIKPKFHEGDWIITNKKHIWYVDETPETTSYLYRLINQYGKVEVAEFEVVDKKARLWTLQDAKDGDILFAKGSYFKEYTFIYSGMTEDNVMSTYCGFDMAHNNFDTKLSRFGRMEDFEAIFPATKEQRDLLFQKMHDTGYEWDTEHKQLNKIEQKLAGWSDYDECMLTNLIDDPHCSIDSEYVHWFKALKEKYTWKPSDEHITWLYRAADEASKDSRMKQILNELLSDLKKLRGK